MKPWCTTSIRRAFCSEISKVYRLVRVNIIRAIKAEDGAVILLDHESGVTGVINGNRYLNPELPGPAMGEAWLEGDENWIRIAANGDLYLANRAGRGNPPPTEGYKGDSVRATQRHFIDCLKSGRPFETGVAEYLPTFAAVEAAYRSAESKKQVRIAECSVG